MPDNKNHSLHAACDWQLKERLEKYCGRSGRKESDVIIDAVTRFLDDPVVKPHPAYRELMQKIGENPAQAKPLVSSFRIPD